ncbi:MAG TPA: nuclear transport factor 2 family protein [Phycisphaerales bacterium]|nr:nuclear transport factor 2 family protein [Phycisphaerales bacterium]
MRTLTTLVLAAALLLTAPFAHAQGDQPPAQGPAPQILPLPPNPKVFDITRVRGGVDVPYLVTFPPDYQPGPPYPVLIYFGDGEQDRAAVLKQLEQWETEAAKRKWVLVGIAKPILGVASLMALPQDSWQGVLEEIGRILSAEGDGYYLAGTGEGGRAALYLGGLIPSKVRAVAPINAGADPAMMGVVLGLKDTPVKFIHRNDDQRVLQEVHRTMEALRKAGSRRVYPCDLGNHPNASSQLVFGFLPKLVQMESDDGEKEKVSAVLDDLHDAAAKADEARYFSLYAEGAVFLGTDAKERWTLEEFRAFAHPYFARGKAWTYTPVEGGRFITIEGKERDVAWFDEKLSNAKLGLCRGSGVLIKVNGEWKVKQYNLTMLVPNELAEEVAKKSREQEPQP